MNTFTKQNLLELEEFKNFEDNIEVYDLGTEIEIIVKTNSIDFKIESDSNNYIGFELEIKDTQFDDCNIDWDFDMLISDKNCCLEMYEILQEGLRYNKEEEAWEIDFMS